jgi:hypothetical protein
MKTAHRTASQHKRRWSADPLAMFKCVNKIEPFSPAELMRLELPIRMSFESVKNGTGCESDFHDIAAAINTAMVRSEAVDPLCEQTALAARDALMRTWHRFERSGKWGFDGPALAEIDAGIDLHEQLIRGSTPLQMIEALREVMQRGQRLEIVT